MKKQSHNKDIICYKSSFVCYFHYFTATQILLVVMRDGKQYRYLNVPLDEANELMNCTNCVNYIFRVIGKKYSVELLQSIVPAATIETILTPPPITRWLSS